MRFKIQLSLAALIYTTVFAVAADNMPIRVGEMTEPPAFKSSAGWYLRGNVSYVASAPVYDFTYAGQESYTRPFGFGVGLGYRFGDMVRTDLTMNHVTSSRNVERSTADISGWHNIWSTLLNGYMDLGVYGHFTPYVGAGVGLLRTLDTIGGGLPAPVPRIASTQAEFAYALNAGVGYRMSDNLTLDFGYQFLSSPKTQYIDTQTLTAEDGINLHQIQIGLRYSLQ